jgi:hypothetical protein
MKKIITGFCSTFDPADGGENLPIEHKRNIREDASWYYKNIPCILDEQFMNNYLPVLSEEQAVDIRYERNKLYKERGIIKSATDEDVFNAQIGEPTSQITKELLYAETHREIDTELAKAHGSKGWLESLVRPDGYTMNITPTQRIYNKNYRTPLANMTNEQLLYLMFRLFHLLNNAGSIIYGKKDYVKKIEQRFRQKSGYDLEHNIEKWADGKNTKKDALIAAIKQKITKCYATKCFPIDVSQEMGRNFLDFSGALLSMPAEAAAFGGIQQINIDGTLLNEKIQVQEGTDGYGKFKVSTFFLDIELKFVLKDWFGVDEDDIIKNETAAQVGRESLAAFWVLQHQKGFRPFINIINYKENISVSWSQYEKGFGSVSK